MFLFAGANRQALQDLPARGRQLLPGASRRFKAFTLVRPCCPLPGMTFALYRVCPKALGKTMSGLPEFDPLTFHATALKLRSLRQQVLSSNLANADTPGYRARDFDFARALNEQLGATVNHSALPVSRTNKGHLASASRLDGPEMLYRASHQPSLDGNTVDPDVERAQFGENAVMTEATLTFLNSTLRSRLSAITGQ